MVVMNNSSSLRNGRCSWLLITMLIISVAEHAEEREPAISPTQVSRSQFVSHDRPGSSVRRHYRLTVPICLEFARSPLLELSECSQRVPANVGTQRNGSFSTHRSSRTCEQSAGAASASYPGRQVRQSPSAALLTRSHKAFSSSQVTSQLGLELAACGQRIAALHAMLPLQL